MVASGPPPDFGKRGLVVGAGVIARPLRDLATRTREKASLTAYTELT